MTGRYTIHNTIEDWLHPTWATGVPLNETFMPELLKENGYATHAVGKWHMGFCKWDYTPTFRGFDSYIGYYDGSEDYFTHVKDNWYDLHKEIGPNCGFNCSEIYDRRGDYSVNIFSERAVEIIEDLEDEPLFLYLSYQSVHMPY